MAAGVVASVQVPEDVEPVGDDETRPAPRKKPRDG